MPTTAPKVSRFGIRVGTAPPVAWLDAAEEAPDWAGFGEGVVLPEGEPELEGAPVLTVALSEFVGVRDAVAVADSTLQLLEGELDGDGVLDATLEELEGVGSFTICATMRTFSHWSPMCRS